MNRLFLAVVTCLLIFSFVPLGNVTATSAPGIVSLQTDGTGTVTAPTLNVRSGAGTSFRAFATLKQGDTIQIIGRTTGSTWLNVRLTDGREGWVSAQYVRLPLTSSYPAASSTGIPAGAVPAQLVSVTDGDTIDVLVNGRADTVRYIGIDTPERGQPGFAAATEASRALLDAGALHLVADTSDRDSFGRLLRYVYTSDCNNKGDCGGLHDSTGALASQYCY